MNDELELQIGDRLRDLLALDPDVAGLADVALPVLELTPSKVSESGGLVLALESIGGDGRMATTGDVPLGGKDALTFFFCLSAALWQPERGNGSQEQLRVEVKRSLIQACGVLRRVVRKLSIDPRQVSDPEEKLPLWHKIELSSPGWDYPEVEGQYRLGRIFLRIHAQQRRG